MAFLHTPVLVQEVLVALAVQPGGRYVDCTVGQGGHALAILEASAPGGQVLGIDLDPEAVRTARQRLLPHAGSFDLVNDNFARIQAICQERNFQPVHGVLFDLGLSSLQLEGEARGFSFHEDAALDMRFSPEQQTTAADIVNGASAEEIARILWAYGEERYSRQIARRIVERRPLRTARELAEVVSQVTPRGRHRIHPATRTFQALRIAVNGELQNLEEGLKHAVDILGHAGRLAVISYHSLEDRLVKHFFRQESTDCLCPPGAPVCVCGHRSRARLVTRKPILPTPEEVWENPRSRSARLRALERVDQGIRRTKG
ncbi:MAG: 16S rRNA (cytosine(1402)-N(4))-methyltransferase RsmH [Chloroflexi bacterium]|nr:16S rRNA (cytosine(1402)-N(4))-methyltransferase RsmH [Chloroflexota bacterium]